MVREAQFELRDDICDEVLDNFAVVAQRYDNRDKARPGRRHAVGRRREIGQCHAYLSKPGSDGSLSHAGTDRRPGSGCVVLGTVCRVAGMTLAPYMGPA